ncbi:DNA polymerase III subunit gamma and tau [Cryobacterium gelidum]|uniref:DNA-directed DNA polymerase n=1 Tax=Cryobacterium gelidum TaxID=1259164 RepID=A0A4R9AY44_9MICO|nr:DNA polymerase III subunit gamma and tau [Cryobacterium gelidum]TFD71379.1 DNA polymerase III subunit gamma and tau [Cryobacterium gelidum]
MENVVTALYRRYRPETFAEMIGQSQVTDPLMTALRTNRVNHAYLFSGPRGCGKTTSARILARCLNCAEGPTDTPCGVCPSCVELARDGGGSLDVVEIDAASHNGVDDARDIRERAIFAPARDRYKIFILDEAHMVTPQGFNALLKIVEEPPEHVKFIFATTEPEKVIGTIRSRTHHYPFRLVPPGPMLEYVQQMCDTEKMVVAPGVLPLVVRAGGGSPRDTLSLLDQLMAGSDGQSIEYERAVALLGYTSASLLDEAVEAIGARDPAAAFDAVDRVIQTGQDPRRFVEDLLERMRDLIIVSATSVAGAAAVLRGVPQDELERMNGQAAAFGPAELSRTADILNAALTEMSGATSPRLHLELMIARALIPATDDTTRGALARVERLERRIGVDGVAAAPVAATAPAARPVAPTGPSGGFAAAAAGAPSALVETATAGTPAARPASPSGSGTATLSPAPSAPAASSTAQASSTADASSAPQASSTADASSAPQASSTADASSATGATVATSPSPLVETAPAGTSAARPAVIPGAPVSLQQLKDAWPEILEVVRTEKTTAWLVVYTAHVLGLNGDVLALSFPSQADVDSFKQQKVPGMGTSDFLRTAIVAVLGLRVKFIARVDAGREASSPGASSSPDSPTVTAEPAPAAPAAKSPAATSAGLAPLVAEPVSTSSPAGAPDPAESRASASPVAVSTSGWATVAIPGSPNGPAVPAVADDTTDVPPAAILAAPLPNAAVVPPAVPSVAPSAVPQHDDEPPFDDVPPPFEDDVPPELDAPAEERVPNYAARAEVSAVLPTPEQGQQPGASRQNTGEQSAPTQRQHPNASGQRATTKEPSRAPSFAEKQRYGEAVVREILGATFIEEQPYTAAPRTRNDY